MSNKKIIGTKMNKKRVIINLVFIIVYSGFWTFLGIYMVLGNLLNLNNLTKICLLVLSIVILFIIQLPTIGATQRIEYSNEIIEFYSIKGFINQFLEVIDILINKSSPSAISISVQEIDSVKLSYRQTLGGYGIEGYALKLSFLMKNGTIISLSPENMEKNEESAYFNLLTMLENNNIQIIDQLNLKDGLIKDSIYFQNYIKKLIDSGCTK